MTRLEGLSDITRYELCIVRLHCAFAFRLLDWQLALLFS